MKIPFVDLSAQYLAIKPDIDAAIAGVIANTSFIGGEPVRSFEAAFGSLLGVRHVIGCGNGTDSLYVIMKMLGIGAGDEVITAANSWISSSETITQTGAKPVFADVDPEFYSLDERQLESLITPKTRALIAVHLQGQMCAIEVLRGICDRRKIFLIEDCAQSHLSASGATLAGRYGIAASFSFYPGKNLGAYGDAGCITTDDDALAEKCRMYSHHGALKKHQHVMEGINSRLDSLQAAILGAKLPYLPEWTRARIERAGWYRKYLTGIPEIGLPEQRPGTTHTWHLFVIRTTRRSALAEHLSANGIETAVHYPTALPLLPAYRYLGHRPEDFPVAARLQEEILSLPIYPELTEEQVVFVAACIKSFFLAP